MMCPNPQVLYFLRRFLNNSQIIFFAHFRLFPQANNLNLGGLLALGIPHGDLRDPGRSLISHGFTRMNADEDKARALAFSSFKERVAASGDKRRPLLPICMYHGGARDWASQRLVLLYWLKLFRLETRE